MAENKRKIVIPGEIIAEGEDYLPGEGTEKENDKIFARKYGLAEETNNLIKVIPLSGTYQPRRGNIIIGQVENITMHGWIIDINTANNAFLSLTEVPKYLNREGLADFMDIGDMVVAKIQIINRRGIDLGIKGKGLGKIDEGIIFKINPNKVPRVIGKEGSMINLIKDKTECKITVGQNGLIWIKGEKIKSNYFCY